MKWVMKNLFKKSQNTAVPDTFNQRFREWVCRVFGCIIVGSYYGFFQAWCARCGHKNWCASKGVPEWQKPDEEY